MLPGSANSTANGTQTVPEPAGIIEGPSQAPATGTATGAGQAPSEDDKDAAAGADGTGGGDAAAESAVVAKEALPDQAATAAAAQTLDKAKVTHEIGLWLLDCLRSVSQKDSCGF